MQFDLTRLGRHGRGTERVERKYEPVGVRRHGRSRGPSDCGAGRSAARRASGERRGLPVTGRVATRLALECSRCLEPFEIPVDGTFELRYVPREHNLGEGEREIAEDDLTTAYVFRTTCSISSADARAVPARAAHEAALLGRLQGSVSGVRPISTRRPAAALRSGKTRGWPR